MKMMTQMTQMTQREMTMNNTTDNGDNSLSTGENAPDTTMSEAPIKQYIIMVEEVHMVILSRIFQGLKFLEVEGMNIKDDPKHMIMVTPVMQPSVDNTHNSSLETIQEG